MLQILITTVLILLAAVASSDWTDCAAPCRCKWTSGKKTALCASSNLNNLPNISSDIQVLDLQNNFITYLKSEAFYSIGLINLQKVFMKNTSLAVLHREAFKNLKILIEVDLSDNQLTVISQGTFAGNDRLKVLILNGNPLRELAQDQFPPLPHLRSLEIENCKLRVIHDRAFVNLHQLEGLSLRNNQLETLNEKTFNPIIKLKSLALDNNPWKCDCHLRPLRNWYLSSKLHSMSLKCSSPETLKQKTWEEIDPKEFACAPTAKTTDKMIQRDIGENVTFGCLGSGDPEPEVYWLFNGRHIEESRNASTEDRMIIVADDGVLDKWFNVTLINLTDSNAGEYSCVVSNVLGVSSENISLILPQVVTATTLSKDEKYSSFFGLVCGGIVTVVACITLTLICGYNKKRKSNAQKLRCKSSSSFTDQEKKLLDISIASTAEQSTSAWNSDMIMRSPESESRMIDNQGSIQLESCDGLRVYQEPGVVIPIPNPYSTAVGVYPPPPEFSSGILPQTGFGNIFISVSVSQDPYSDIQRYPDLLDIPYKSSGGDSSVSGSISSRSGPSVSYATLPRRPNKVNEPTPPVHDKLGPRVTVEGSSIVYHSEIKESPPPPPQFISEYVSL